MAPTQEQARRLQMAKLAGGSGSGKSSSKQPKARVQRYLKSIEPQLQERTKSTLLFKGIQCSQHMGDVLKELRALQAPHSKLLNKKNQITPFSSDTESIEFLTTKNDCALFVMASTNKKRPNNLVIGRTFDRQVLDMCELGVLRFKSALNGDYPGSVPKKRIGSKPLLLFCGDLWQTSKDHEQLQNLLTDFYRGDVVDKLVANGLDHLIVFTLAQPPPTTTESTGSTTSSVRLHQRTYYCQLKKDPTNPQSTTPVPWLENCGPDLDFVLRRTQWASPELARAARKLPAPIQAQLRKSKSSNKSAKKKNQSTTIFGETMGRLHVAKQDLERMGGRKAKALRRAEKQEALEEQAAVEQELQAEQQQEE